MEFIYLLCALIWSILSIILFFKVWGMCNDVEKIVGFLLDNKAGHRPDVMKESNGNKEEVKDEDNEVNDEPVVDLNELNGIVIGDIVTWKENGKTMKVTSIKSNGIYVCKFGSMVLNFKIDDIEK